MRRPGLGGSCRIFARRMPAGTPALLGGLVLRRGLASFQSGFGNLGPYVRLRTIRNRAIKMPG